MKRAVILLGSLAVLMILSTACPAKKKVPLQPPIPPPPAETIPAEAETLPPLPPTLPTPAVKSAYGLGTIHFDFDKYDIRPGDAKILAENAEYLRANANTALVLEGYCDPIGTDEYNRGLGLRRANAAKTYLTELGIDASRLSAISYGKEKLVTTDTTKFELNRRVEFVVK